MALRTHSAGLEVPGPPPLLGGRANVIRFLADPVGHTGRLFATYGSVVALSRGGGTNLYSPLEGCPGTVLARGSEPIRQAAMQHEVYHKEPLTATFYPTGDVTPRTAPLKHLLVGLFGVNGQEHHRHRRLLMPAFHRQRIESYRDAMVEITASALDGWRFGQRLDLAEQMRVLTLRIVTRTLFGEDVGERGVAAARSLQEATRLLASPGLSLLRLDWPGLPYRRFLDLAALHQAEVRWIVERKRDAGDGGDVLSMLIRARDEESGAALTEDELLGHVGVIFAAGHETSATALTWTQLLLSQHPRVTADLLDELDGVLHGDPPTVEQLGRLPLLGRVVDESLRVLPPVLFNGRVTAQPTEFAGHPIPTGTEVLASIYHTHHLPELFPHPERFDPGRWETIEPSVFAYGPFSSGARRCLGASFAQLEIKIVLAMMLQRFRLQSPPAGRVDRSGLIVLAPRGGLPMVAHRQDRQFEQGVGGLRGNLREMVELPA